MNKFLNWFRTLSTGLQTWAVAVALLGILIFGMWYSGTFDRIGMWWDHRQDAKFDERGEVTREEYDKLVIENETIRQDNARLAETLAASEARQKVWRALAEEKKVQGAEIDHEITEFENKMRDRNLPAVVDPDALLRQLRERKKAGRRD